MVPVSVPPVVRDALAAFAAWARERFGARIYRLALFGSFARGEGTLPDSDVDVLIAVEDLGHDELFDIAQRGAEVGTDHALAFTTLPMSAGELREMERQQRLFVRELARDGIAL